MKHCGKFFWLVQENLEKESNVLDKKKGHMTHDVFQLHDIALPHMCLWMLNFIRPRIPPTYLTILQILSY